MNALELDRENLNKTISKLLMMTRESPYNLRSHKTKKESFF